MGGRKGEVVDEGAQPCQSFSTTDSKVVLVVPVFADPLIIVVMCHCTEPKRLPRGGGPRNPEGDALGARMGEFCFRHACIRLDEPWFRDVNPITSTTDYKNKELKCAHA